MMINAGSKREREHRKVKRSGPRREDGSDDEPFEGEVDTGASSSSSIRNATKEEKAEEKKSVEENWDELVEHLSEKRSATRLTALHTLTSALQSSYVPNFIQGREETLKMYLLNSLRKGETAEVEAASMGIRLMAITLGMDSEELYKQALPVCLEIGKNTSKSAGSRGAAIDAAALLTFIAAQHPEETVGVMNQLLDFFKLHSLLSYPEAVAESILDGWGLLASTLPTVSLGTSILQQSFGLLFELLDHESLDVRTAAGENIALLFSAKQEIAASQGQSQDREGEMDDDENKASSSSASSSSSVTDALETELINKLRALSTDSSRRRAKKERAEQRKSFRDILRTVEDGDVPEEKLQVKKQKHTFEGWDKVLQLAALRNALQKGLPVHLMYNDLLQQILDVDGEGEEETGNTDDPVLKQQLRAQSKARAKEMYEWKTKQRKKKTAHAFEADS